MIDDRLDSLAERLEQIAEDIDELAFDMLREAVQKGQSRPPLDKTLLQARRAVTKAAVLMRGTTTDD